jgi:hypothetical protein
MMSVDPESALPAEGAGADSINGLDHSIEKTWSGGKPSNGADKQHSEGDPDTVSSHPASRLEGGRLDRSPT